MATRIIAVLGTIISIVVPKVVLLRTAILLRKAVTIRTVVVLETIVAIKIVAAPRTKTVLKIAAFWLFVIF